MTRTNREMVQIFLRICALVLRRAVYFFLALSFVRGAQRHRLLGFFLLRLWTAAAERLGLLTRQENAVVQACRVDVSDGFGTYLLAMSDAVAKQETEADDNALNSKNPHLVWMIAFLFLVSFAGLLALVPLRKVMIVDYRLSYPSGLAAAYLINGLHATEDNKNAK